MATWVMDSLLSCYIVETKLDCHEWGLAGARRLILQKWQQLLLLSAKKCIDIEQDVASKLLKECRSALHNNRTLATARCDNVYCLYAYRFGFK